MRGTPRLWLALAAAAIVVLLALVATGPIRTVDAIRQAVEDQDPAALSRQVDFPALRVSLKAQLNDRLVRQAGPRAQSGLLGALALRAGGLAVDAAVEAMVNPVGLAAIMEGRKVWANVGEGVAPSDPRGPGSAPARRPLADPEYRIESLSRVTATVRDEQGRPLTFVLTRQGLAWRLTDIRLPLVDGPDGAG